MAQKDELEEYSEIIDGALDATFSIFQATDEEFGALFSAAGQDMELSEDFHNRVAMSVVYATNALWPAKLAQVHGRAAPWPPSTSQASR